MNKVLSLVLCAAAVFHSCAHSNFSQEEISKESKRINEFFARTFEESVARHPQFATELGLKTNYGQLDDESEAANQAEYEIAKKKFAELKSFNFHKLDEQSRISYRIFEWQSEYRIKDFEYRFHDYPINQMWGVHIDLPAFLMNMHKVESLQDAKDYLSRLKGFQKQFSDIVHGLKEREKRGIIPPSFVYSRVQTDIQNLLTGRPFTEKGQSPLLKDFQEKLLKLKINTEVRHALKKEAESILLNQVQNAYKELSSYLKTLEPKSPKQLGAWTLPDGDRFYRLQLAFHTSSDMSPTEVHELGLREVARIHDEIRAIMKKVKFKGDLKDFFQFVSTDRRFRYSQTEIGRAAYLQDSTQIIKKMEKKLPLLFTLKPKAPLVVKAVEPYREQSSGGAFYERPSSDGKRPGIYYVNLYDIAAATKYEMEALAYHEGIPGHHMQIATSIDLKDIPEFRKHAWITAYGEGWALYAEAIPKEIGFYQDPYSDFGRLTMELWRAGRLVVDTGIHYKRWTYEQAVDYFVANTPAPRSEAVNSVNRYSIWPGQATAYKAGMLKIQDLRRKSEEQLGRDFKIQEFHDEVLRNGAMPMHILDEQISLWIKRKNKS